MSATARRRRRTWRPRPTAPWSIDDATAKRMRAAYASDSCVCGHYRVEHTGTGCQRCRRCCGYAWAKAGGVEA